MTVTGNASSSRAATLTAAAGAIVRASRLPASDSACAGSLTAGKGSRTAASAPPSASAASSASALTTPISSHQMRNRAVTSGEPFRPWRVEWPGEKTAAPSSVPSGTGPFSVKTSTSTQASTVASVATNNPVAVSAEPVASVAPSKSNRLTPSNPSRTSAPLVIRSSSISSKRPPPARLR